MENFKINETPVRTSTNFGINNLEIKSLNMPNRFNYFNNIDINVESIKDSVQFNHINNEKLKYGLGEELENQIREKGNCKLKVEVNSILDKEILIDFTFDESNRNLAEYIEIAASERTKSTIILKYKSDDDINYYHNGIIKILANESAQVNIVVINFMGNRATNFLAIENELKDFSRINFTIVDFGGKVSVTNFYSNMLGKESASNLNTIYFAKDKQIFDLNYIDEVKGEKTIANINVQGALDGEARKNFKGTIDFKKGCKKAVGSENESCMLLSEKAKSVALPILLCSEEDVEGEHSTSSGRFDDKEMFYIMSRGFELKSAKKLLVRAKFNSIIEKIKKTELKEEILSRIDKILD